MFLTCFLTAFHLQNASVNINGCNVYFTNELFPISNSRVTVLVNVVFQNGIHCIGTK